MRIRQNIIKMLDYIYEFTFCKIGAHKVEEYDDKFREGEFYCRICGKNLSQELEDWYYEKSITKFEKEADEDYLKNIEFRKNKNNNEEDKTNF
jgi:hypothetical protein